MKSNDFPSLELRSNQLLGFFYMPSQTKQNALHKKVPNMCIGMNGWMLKCFWTEVFKKGFQK